MNIVEKVFLPLTERLDKFSEKQEYKGFSYRDIITAIKEEIFDCSTKDALEGINRSLKRILAIKNVKEDLSDYCLKYEYIEVGNADDYGLLPPVIMYKSEVALSPQEKVHIHEMLATELKFYLTELERLKNIFDAILKQEEEKRLYKKEENQSKKRVSKALSYTYYNDKKGFLDGLRALLIDDNYIQHAEAPKTNVREKMNFRKAFAGGEPPNDKIPWIGTKQTLHYFIDGMYKRLLLKGSCRWVRTKACFDFEGSLDNIVGQKDPTDKEKKVLDAILDEFEGWSKEENTPTF